MSQTPIQKYGINKQEQKENLIWLIISAACTILMLILFLVFNGKVNNMKNNLDYLLRPSYYQDEINTYAGCATFGIIFFCIGLVSSLFALYSFFMLRCACLSVYEDHIAGYAGIHWNGFCLRTKSVTIAYDEIASVGVHKIKALQNRYVIVNMRNGKKQTFAVEDVGEAIDLINEHLPVTAA